MAYNPAGFIDPAQIQAIYAAAMGIPPWIAPIPAQHAPLSAYNQVNPFAHPASHHQQVPVHPVPWANLPQLFQLAPQPQPQPPPQLAHRQQQHHAKRRHKDIEHEYHKARSAKLDNTLVLSLRDAQRSRRSRHAILKNMDGCHGHSAEWWRNYYLIFHNDIERLVKSGASRMRQGDVSSDYDSDVVEVVDDPRAQRSRAGKRKAPQNATPGPSSRPHIASRRTSSPDSDDFVSYSDEPRKRVPTSYDLIIPSMLPERAPSAPTTFVPAEKGNGNKFTKEDLAFFVATVLWLAKTAECGEASHSRHSQYPGRTPQSPFMGCVLEPRKR